MSLSGNVQARYSTQRLANLTRADDQTSTTVNTTVLGYACDDITGEFASSGITYDDTDARHVAVAVEGVIALLTERMGTESGSAAMSRFRTRLDRLRMATANDRIHPGTNSYLQPTNPGSDGTTVRPAFDDERWGDVILSPPISSTTNPDEDG